MREWLEAQDSLEPAGALGDAPAAAPGVAPAALAAAAGPTPPAEVAAADSAAPAAAAAAAAGKARPAAGTPLPVRGTRPSTDLFREWSAFTWWDNVD